MNIIGLVGKKLSGKDTAAQAIITFANRQRNISATRVAFADPVKKEVAKALGVKIEYIEKNKGTLRLLLQAWGTNYRRLLCGDNYWIIRANDKIDYLASIGFTHVFVTDVRFRNEAEFIRQKKGVIWKVERPAHDNNDPHPSELETDMIEADKVLLNKDQLGKFQQNAVMLFKEEYIWEPINRKATQDGIKRS